MGFYLLILLFLSISKGICFFKYFLFTFFPLKEIGSYNYLMTLSSQIAGKISELGVEFPKLDVLFHGLCEVLMEAAWLFLFTF